MRQKDELYSQKIREAKTSLKKDKELNRYINEMKKHRQQMYKVPPNVNEKEWEKHEKAFYKNQLLAEKR